MDFVVFISTQLSHAFPTLLESLFIQSYHTHFPGEIAHKWRRRKVHYVGRGEGLQQTS